MAAGVPEKSLRPVHLKGSNCFLNSPSSLVTSDSSHWQRVTGAPECFKAAGGRAGQWGCQLPFPPLWKGPANNVRAAGGCAGTPGPPPRRDRVRSCRRPAPLSRRRWGHGLPRVPAPARSPARGAAPRLRYLDRASKTSCVPRWLAERTVHHTGALSGSHCHLNLTDWGSPSYL